MPDMDAMWKEILWRQFGAALDMFENALNECSPELWGKRMWVQYAEFSEFWYVAYHTLFWVDLYLSGTDEGFQPPAPFTLGELDPAGVLPPRQYSKDELLAYLVHCREKSRATIGALTDERARQVCKFPWGELCFAELLIDNLRHVQEHGAQLRMFLGQQRGFSPRWVAQAKGPDSG
jgi:hypothetical protein